MKDLAKGIAVIVVFYAIFGLFVLGMQLWGVG
jgi:hypothetical protein